MSSTPLNPLRVVCATSVSLGIGVFALIVSACSGNSGGSPAAPAPPPGSPSYSLSVGALNPTPVTAGNKSASTITLTPANGYSGSVTLSCGTISGGTQAPSCSFSPSAVMVSAGKPGASTLTVSTLVNTPGGNYAITVNASDANKLAPSNGAQGLTLTAAAVIQHVVIIFQENRTPDNLFQDPVLIARGADIVQSGKNSKGQIVPLSPIDLGTVGSNPQTYDISHMHDAFVSMYDGGKMDGADLIACSPAPCPANAQFKYVKPADVQPYFALAEQYTFGDAMFQTNQGPSFPAHQFILAGTSAPTGPPYGPPSSLFASENPIYSATEPTGCIGPANNTVAWINAAGIETAPVEKTCFDHQTLTDELDTKGLSWRYYAPSAGSIWTAPDAIDHICKPNAAYSGTCVGPIWTTHVVIPDTQILTDIANGQLAQVTWVIPGGLQSDHAKSNDGSGPAWVASVVNAIGGSAYWENTAIIIAWDDWGGWYDHVPPFKIVNDGTSWGSGYVYGFRVPLIVVSPYAKAAYISHVIHDFGSILKYIETTFTLPSLGYADAAAPDDLADCFDLTQSPLTFKQIPAALSAADFLNDKRAPTPPDDD